MYFILSTKSNLATFDKKTYRFNTLFGHTSRRLNSVNNIDPSDLPQIQYIDSVLRFIIYHAILIVNNIESSHLRLKIYIDSVLCPIIYHAVLIQ